MVKIRRILNQTCMFVFILMLMTCNSDEKSNPTATIETNKGEIVVELYPDAAPETVENFVTLIQQARLANSG